MIPSVFRAAAAADVEDAWTWYEARREGLGDEFLDAVQASLESLCAHPESAPLVHRDIRRWLLRRFPYGLFYRLIQGQVVVVACFHAKRSPRVWRSRYSRRTETGTVVTRGDRRFRMGRPSFDHEQLLQKMQQLPPTGRPARSSNDNLDAILSVGYRATRTAAPRRA